MCWDKTLIFTISGVFAFNSHHQISVFCHVSFFLVGFFQLLLLSMHRRFILCMYYLPSRCLWLWIFVVYAFTEVSAELFIFICFCAAMVRTFILAFQVSY
uniref:Uncharacterized protein n=1 Tax=Populus trichocarpa TaxID=3694 RepID=A0A2K2AEY2_POPTR